MEEINHEVTPKECTPNSSTLVQDQLLAPTFIPLVSPHALVSPVRPMKPDLLTLFSEHVRKREAGGESHHACTRRGCSCPPCAWSHPPRRGFDGDRRRTLSGLRSGRSATW